MRKMGQARLVALTAIGVFTGGVLIDAAEARVGRSRGGSYRSFGNRGSRSFDSGGPGSQMQPISGNRQNRTQPNNQPNNRGSWFQRNPLLGGLMGAIAGTVIGSMLMNAFGGMGGGFGGILLLLLAGLAVFAVLRMVKRPQPKLAGGTGRDNFNFGNGNLAGSHFGGGYGNTPLGDFNDGNSGGTPMNTQMNTQSRDQGLAAIALEDSSMTNTRLQDSLTNHFFQIQEGWSAGNRVALNTAATAEMYDELMSDLEAMEQRGERNIIKNIVMRSFDITEAWQEGEVEYVTAFINARLIDYTERNGKVIEGDANTPVQFSEYWTFTRQRGRGDWKLSAINQST